jgi:putative holliday junction resolvase
MSNILAIDYGSKWVGLAYAPAGTHMALPHGTIAREDDAQVVAAIIAHAVRESADLIVVGMPLLLSGDESAQSKRTKDFVAMLRESAGCRVVTYSEAYTSSEAAARGGSGSSIHERSAMILLEDWLEMHRA